MIHLNWTPNPNKVLLYQKMLSPCVACSYPAEITCAHDCSLELRPAGVCWPCLCYWTPSKDGGHIQPAWWGWFPVPLITETQPAFSMCVWHHSSDPQLILPGRAAFPAWRAHDANSVCLTDHCAQLHFFSIPCLYTLSCLTFCPHSGEAQMGSFF